MYVLEKMRSLFYRYYQRKDGNFSILAAVSMLTIVTFVGAAYDISRLQSAKVIAQDAADSMALSASIAVD